MNQKHTPQQIEQAWLRAVERATDSRGRQPEFDTAYLREIVGFQIRSSVRAGRGYFSTYPTGCPQRCG